MVEQLFTPEAVLPHVFMVSYPGQGHVNPLLRLGKILASKGLLVTLSAPDTIGNQIRKSNKNVSEEPTPFGAGMIRFEFFDDESDKITEPDLHAANLEKVGKEKLPEMLRKNADSGRPVCCLIYSCFIPWVAEVGESLGIPSAPLWVQSAACFSAYYHFYNNVVPFPTESEPELDVQLPYMPLLKYDEIPSFLHPWTQYPSLTDSILGMFKHLSKNSCVLMESFDELESKEIQYMSKLCPIKPIGPLFRYPINGAPESTNVTVNVYTADDCTSWLDSKPESSVVYLSFGSAVVLEQAQVDEIAHGLLNSGVPFLWVMRPSKTVLPSGFLDRVGENGKIVKWSNQQQVLEHPSVACFVTHCGWNSTMETLSSGMPVITFPSLGDQVTDAKYLVDVFKVGIRLSRGDFEKRIIPRDEIEKCLLEATTGAKAAEMKQNAMKFKKAAEEAVSEVGSSTVNLLKFLDELTVSIRIPHLAEKTEPCLR